MISLLMLPLTTSSKPIPDQSIGKENELFMCKIMIFRHMCCYTSGF